MNQANPDQPQDADASPAAAAVDPAYQAWRAAQAQAPVGDDPDYLGDPATPVSPVPAVDFSTPAAPVPTFPWTPGPSNTVSAGPAVLPAGVTAPPLQAPAAPAPPADASQEQWAQFAAYQAWVNAGRPGAPAEVAPEPPVELDEHLASLEPGLSVMAALKDLATHLAQTHPVLETRRLLAQLEATWNRL